MGSDGGSKSLNLVQAFQDSGTDKRVIRNMHTAAPESRLLLTMSVLVLPLFTCQEEAFK